MDLIFIFQQDKAAFDTYMAVEDDYHQDWVAHILGIEPPIQ